MTTPRCRALWLSRWVLAYSLGVLLASRAAAQQGRSVEVACPVLSDEGRAEIAARLTGELLVNRLDGTLSLSCTPDSLRGRFQGPGGVFEVEHAAQVDVDTPEAFYRIGLELIERALSASVPEPHADADVDPRDTPPRIAPQASPERVPSVSAPPHTIRSWRLAASVGAQVWGSEVLGAIGPELQAELALLRALGLTTRLTPYFPLGAAEGFRVQDTRWGIDVVFAPAAWLRFGAGPVLSLARASGPAAVTGGDQYSLRPAVEGYGELMLAAPGVTAFLRLGLGWCPVERVVEHNRERVLSVPRVQPLLNLGLRTQ